MSKPAGSPKDKPKSIVIDTSAIGSVKTQEITIQLQKPNKNRAMKAIIGIGLLIAGPTIVFQSLGDAASCIFCFGFMGLGLSLIAQSFRSSHVTGVQAVSYFIISVCLVIFTFLGLLIFAFSSIF